MDLIARIQQRIRTPGMALDEDLTGMPATLYPPATPQKIRGAEARLGFPLPDLLRRIYAEVGNGGFGPGYGIIGLKGGHEDDGEFLDDLYLRYLEPDPEEPLWTWPERMIPFCHWGCGIFSCVDASRPEAPVYGFDPNPHNTGESWEGYLFPHRPSLEEWLTAWVDGVDLWEDMGRAYEAQGSTADQG